MSIELPTSFTGLLTIVFITLKLTGYISWPWIWVISPILIPIAIALLIFLVWLVLALITVFISNL